MRILIVTAVDVEHDTILYGVQKSHHHYDIITVGVGPVAAAVHTTTKLSAAPYDLVLNMGIAGGFTPHAEVGSLVIADQVIYADLGAESERGFLSLDKLGFGTTSIHLSSPLVMHTKDTFLKERIPTTVGPILTVSTATGTTHTAKNLSTHIPGAVAEAMEGFAVASSAEAFGIPFMEIRAISNPVGPRDQSAWRIDEALKTLTKASAILAEEEFSFENCIFTLS